MSPLPERDRYFHYICSLHSITTWNKTNPRIRSSDPRTPTPRMPLSWSAIHHHRTSRGANGTRRP